MKKFILAFLIISSIFSTVTFAGTLVKKVYFSTFPIKINNEEYSSETPILQYQDRTYVALREFSEMVGVNVDFIDNEIIIETGDFVENKKELENVTTEFEIVQDEKNEKTTTDSDFVQVKSAENVTIDSDFFKKESEEKKEVQGRVVYVSKSGKKYHNLPNCNSAQYTAISISEALSKGYTPCLRCANVK